MRKEEKSNRQAAVCTQEGKLACKGNLLCLASCLMSEKRPRTQSNNSEKYLWNVARRLNQTPRMQYGACLCEGLDWVDSGQREGRYPGWLATLDASCLYTLGSIIVRHPMALLSNIRKPQVWSHFPDLPKLLPCILRGHAWRHNNIIARYPVNRCRDTLSIAGLQ